MNTETNDTQTAVGVVSTALLAPFGLRIRDYSTMAKGSWRIERDMPDDRRYVEFWNDDANKWCAACTVYRSELEALGRAWILVANVEARNAPPLGK